MLTCETSQQERQRGYADACVETSISMAEKRGGFVEVQILHSSKRPCAIDQVAMHTRAGVVHGASIS